MIFNIEAFTNKGSIRKMNQDLILIHDIILNEGTFSVSLEKPTRCFVADGVGGHAAGEIAAELLLRNLNERLPLNVDPSNAEILSICHSINQQLIKYGQDYSQFEGMATTLAGIIFYDKYYRLISAGDSSVMLLRNKCLRKLSFDQVLAENIPNSPITSYFGGSVSSLDLTISSGQDEIQKDDIFMVSSDGIFKVYMPSQIEKILSNSKTLKEKADFIFYKAIQNGAPDNISCIFIEVQQSLTSG